MYVHLKNYGILSPAGKNLNSFSRRVLHCIYLYLYIHTHIYIYIYKYILE